MLRESAIDGQGEPERRLIGRCHFFRLEPSFSFFDEQKRAFFRVGIAATLLVRENRGRVQAAETGKRERKAELRTCRREEDFSFAVQMRLSELTCADLFFEIFVFLVNEFAGVDDAAARFSVL